MMDLLHVYGQEAWHDDVFVVGNREALLRLRAAIDEALTRKDGRVAEVMVADGEGYDVVVLLEDGPWQGDTWKRLTLPYSAKYAAGEVGLQPWELWDAIQRARTIPSQA